MANPPSLPSCCNDHDPDALSLEQARAQALTQVGPVQGRECLMLRLALGRVLADPVIAPGPVPAHDNAAMDGYALAGADLPRQGTADLEIIGTAWAGRPFLQSIRQGQCVRIMTGAMIPSGCDTVIMQEHVEVQGRRVHVTTGHRPGENIRPAGEDIRAGQNVLEAGTLITPARLGLLASLGRVEVSVYRRLRVALFSTGDELTALGRPLAAGGIYDSNRHTLFGMLARLGVELIDMGVVRDEPRHLREAFEEGARCADVLITTGGVSVGEADFVRELLGELGRISFWKVAIKPGRPMAFGHLGQTVFMGLPGNPVSAAVTFYQIVQPALRRMMGETDVSLPPSFPVRCLSDLKKRPGRMEFQRGVLSLEDDGEWVVRATGSQGSGVLSAMSEANCFIVLDLEQGPVAAGGLVKVQPFQGLI
ncbi:molybdopterin molybdotransferase MoeA [Ectothiorhodospira lacustris]|uniref:molybdopterin molybdotransferase MoeA n=1 Tax=Ectothiorhodospira lacustris TaxID=2899127 RepID=UPI001EE922BF|nr:gephyrin-like molybdotransferase Glp [Ectothiorhodospira lacustris]MCG5500777.1 molybdopterin molybdotransferase MoeA [Ectothiorhodospira lacustris]MCG5509342.1 molybdopterin molybdotransferase MoeA [Ectothiorhodospira lacustris]MCG5521396.1 molybdopterin molybdotransferase MoeA [Ectothiorhodospira lacustris]